MKTAILTLAIALSTVFGISKSASAASPKEEVTSLTEVTRISKIEVHGNVELYISDGNKDQAKVYNHYYAENALVQDQDGILRITSYSAQKLVVWVTVSDLREISAYDNAAIKSFGKISALDIDVKLHDQALAKLDIDAYEAHVSLAGKSKADLSGSIEQGSVQYDRSAYLNVSNLAATNLSKTINTLKGCVRHDELASL